MCKEGLTIGYLHDDVILPQPQESSICCFLVQIGLLSAELTNEINSGTNNRKIPKISPSTYKPLKLVTQKTLR